MITGFNFLPDFSNFFIYLLPYIIGIGPVEPYSPGLVLYPVCLDQGGKGGGNTTQHPFCTIFFLHFQLFPVVDHFTTSGYLPFAKNMRVSENKLFIHCVYHICNIKCTLFIPIFA